MLTRLTDIPLTYGFVVMGAAVTSLVALSLYVTWTNGWIPGLSSRSWRERDDQHDHGDDQPRQDRYSRAALSDYRAAADFRGHVPDQDPSVSDQTEEPSTQGGDPEPEYLRYRDEPQAVETTRATTFTRHTVPHVEVVSEPMDHPHDDAVAGVEDDLWREADAGSPETEAPAAADRVSESEPGPASQPAQGGDAPVAERAIRARKGAPAPAAKKSTSKSAEKADARSETASVAAPDDLTVITGIGPSIAKQLASMGVTRFDQLATLSGEELDRIDASLKFRGRSRRERWVEQAADLAGQANPKSRATKRAVRKPKKSV